LAAYQKYADILEKGFREASSFLNELKIIWNKDIPYPPQIITLAATFAIAGNEAQTIPAKRKLSQWFWSVTLGELYGSSTESRMSRDVPELVEWIRGRGDRPRSIDEALFQRDRLHSLRSRLSAAYKGLHALMMDSGCRDFITGRPTDIMTFFEDQIDIHHIFPQDWCKRQGISEKVFNSIINKTPLSRRSNAVISGKAPSLYLNSIEQNTGIEPDQLDNILRTHLIEPKHLRADDFEAFFAARREALCQLVSGAMGKPVVGNSDRNEMETEFLDPFDEADEENT
jgi:hypothetical protein